MTVSPPSARTLAKYGLSLADWRIILRRQRGACGVCGKTGVRLQVDHEHAPRWRKMPAAERRRFVRGGLCAYCNHYVVGRHRRPELLLAGARYLQRYERRRGNA